MEVLTLLGPDGDGGKGTLPVFSFKEEARIFLRFEVPANAGWRVRETKIGELVSVLLCLSVRRVVLDPLPVEVGCEAMSSLVSLDRRSYLRILVGELEFPPSPQGSSSCKKSYPGRCSRMPPLVACVRDRVRQNER